jgi:hypothetical protein
LEVSAARPDAFRPDLARSLHNLSNRLADLGRPQDALDAGEEAVTIRPGVSCQVVAIHQASAA